MAAPGRCHPILDQSQVPAVFGGDRPSALREGNSLRDAEKENAARFLQRQQKERNQRLSQSLRNEETRTWE